MPSKDRHGKTAQDYRSALIAELDAVPDYRRLSKSGDLPYHSDNCWCSPRCFRPIGAGYSDNCIQLLSRISPMKSRNPNPYAFYACFLRASTLERIPQSILALDEEFLRYRRGFHPRCQEPALAREKPQQPISSTTNISKS